ncbi:MAG: MFS transporter, partial [Endomicrobium sp.]|nr:MFS transporter [Endomicrobium sp.]
GNERLLELEKYETAADEFYKINERRNEHFLNNIEDLNKTQKILNASFDKSEEENAIASLAGAKKIYAVITGGFHTKALSDEFRKRGISNIVITPNVSDDAGLWKSGYHRIAKEQSKILFNALAVLPLSLNPEEIKATVLASAVKSVKDVNKILEKQISKAAGVKSAAIEEDENGSAILKLDTVLKRITYIYDGNAKEFIKPVYEPQKRKKEAKKLKSQNQNAGAEEISIFSPIEIIRRIFKKDGVNFQSKVDLLQQNRLTVSAATLSMPIEEIQTVIERLNAQSIDASALPENIKIPVKVIKSVAENELWLLQTKELLKARGIEPNIDNIIKLPQSSFSVRKVFDAVNIDEDALRWVEENVSPQTGNKSAILSQLVLFIGNNYAAANALISKGLKAALIQRVESRPKNYKKLSPLAPNVVVPVEYNGAIYEFKIEHYVPKDASIFEKTISIKAAVIGVSAQYKDGYDRLPTEVQTALKDKAYSMSHRYFASNIENNVKYMQHILGVSGTGAIFYDGGVPDESSSSESFLEIPNGKFGKYFDAQGLSIGVGNLLGEIAAVKERFKQKSIKAYKYARAIDLDKSKIALDKNKTEKFVASEIARNASAIRIKSKNAAAVVRALRRKSAPEVSAEISDDILKMENLLSSEGVKKILVLNLADVSEALLRDVYEIGFDGVYIEGVKSKDFENAIKLVGKISAIYPNASENFIETDAKTAITRKKNLKDAKIVPSIKISKNANAQTISAALENLDEAAVAINSIRVGDELAASQDVVSTAFLNNTAGVSKDASDVKNLKENRYLKIYYAALEIARKSDFVYGKLQNAGALAPYGAAENFEIQDFAGMKAALKAAGLSDDSPVLKYIEISQDGIGGYAAAKAYIQALIEKHYKLYETADTDSDSGKTVSKKKKSFLSSFSFIPLRVNAAKVYAGSDFFNSGADSSEDFALKIKDLRKNGVNNFEFQIKSLDSEIYVLLNGSLIPARQVLEIAAKNSKTKIIFNADELYQNASDDFTDFFNLISKYSAKISIMSSNADFIKRYGEKFPKTAFIFDIGYRTNADTLLSELNILPNLEAVALDARTYEILKELLHEKVNGVLLEIFIKTSPEDEYNDFISESKNSVNIISSKPVENFKKYKNALSAQGNIKILPFILLISSLDLFNSFWALYITSAGHPLSLVNLSIALCAPVYISSSFIAKYFSSKIGQRNTIIAFLFLQILGSSLLYFSGGSWIFVFLYLIMPIFAQGGVNTLFTPFMQSSLNAIDKLDKAEQVSAKSRSLVWIGIGVGILAGGALAAIIGQGGVIIASTALLSTMFVYVFKNSATLERAKQILESVRNKFNLKEKIKSAYLDLKEIFKNKKLFQIFISTTLLEILMTAVVPVEIQPLLTDIGFAVPAIAVIFFLASAIQSFVNNIASKGKILDIVKNEKPRNLYWAVLIGLMLIFVLTNNPIAFIAFFILIEVFQALSMTVESSYSAQNISEKRIELFYLFKLIFDATLSAVFSVVIAKAGGESSDASILGKIILGSTAVSFAIYFLAQIPYKIHNNSKKLKIFKKDVLNLNNADKILKAA